MPVAPKPLQVLYGTLFLAFTLAINAAVIHPALLPIVFCAGLVLLAYFDVRDGDMPLWALAPLVVAAGLGHELVALPALVAAIVATPWLRAHPRAIGIGDIVVMIALPAALPPWWGYGALVCGLLLSAAYGQVFNLRATRAVPFLALAGIAAAIVAF